ncbi:MAG TPA: transcriptional regulator GcvA [Burkholderiaceae bacterium]|nr:transcriptional regulator GcvA [Burkholderiaceae bacterium]
MTSRLPPLSAVRVFEAAARHASFSAAADELFVTHGAISHQVKALEAHLGVTLFRREGRRVALTDEGRFFAERVRSALSQIAEAAAALVRRKPTNRLTISALPSFAARWLMPRIGGFMARHPEIEVSIQATMALADFDRDQVDVAVRFGRGQWPRMHSELLLPETYFPVCSPRLNDGKLPRVPRDLARLPLLRSSQEPWQPWFRVAGLDWPEPTGLDFNDAGIMLQAAVEQRGVALARRSIAELDLAAGRLVRLFDVDLPSDSANYVTWPGEAEAPRKVLAFREWLFDEVAAAGQNP